VVVVTTVAIAWLDTGMIANKLFVMPANNQVIRAQAKVESEESNPARRVKGKVIVCYSCQEEGQKSNDCPHKMIPEILSIS